MVASILSADDFDAAEHLLQELIGYADDAEVGELSLGEWAVTKVYIPDPDIKSAIAAPFMEAFLDIQRQIWQLGAFGKTGVADTKQLNERDRKDLEIIVVVQGGSSEYLAQLAKPIERCFKALMGKLTGKQVAILMLGTAILFSGTSYWSAWLEHQKTLKTDELRSKEHLEALARLAFASKDQLDAFQKIIETMERQGEAGIRAVSVVRHSYDALLRAATKEDRTRINGRELSAGDADSLRLSARKKATIRYVEQKMRVIGINTADQDDIVTLMDDSSKEQHRTKLPTSLFAGEDRKKLFDALEKRVEIWAELAYKEIDGEVRAVDLLRILDEPSAPPTR